MNKFRRLTFIRENGRNKHGALLWLCRCDCGTEKTFIAGNVKSGGAKSCGCWNREVAARRCSARATHGARNTPTYATWMQMRVRCSRSTNHNFAHYGGRGIRVCDRWAKFENFLADMGPRPSLLHSIDRIDNDGNYCPENCRWAHRIQQANNKRSNRIVLYRGEKMSLSDALRRAGNVVGKSGARLRLIRGWSVERAVETPSLQVRAAA